MNCVHLTPHSQSILWPSSKHLTTIWLICWPFYLIQLTVQIREQGNHISCVELWEIVWQVWCAWLQGASFWTDKRQHGKRVLVASRKKAMLSGTFSHKESANQEDKCPGWLAVSYIITELCCWPPRVSTKYCPFGVICQSCKSKISHAYSSSTNTVWIQNMFWRKFKWCLLMLNCMMLWFCLLLLRFP